MKTKKKNTHRGEVLLQVVASSGMNISQLVKKVGVSRSAYYNHITDPHLTIDTLLKYGRVLHYDFLDDFPDLLPSRAADHATSFAQLTNAESKEEAEKQRDIWKEKYYELLEKYLALKEEAEKNA